MSAELTTLKTRRGTYRVPHVDLWRARFDRPQGVGVLEPGARVMLIGSCFSRHGAAYLRRRGYAAQQYRAGYLYNSSVVRLELEHVLEDRPWPAELGLAADGSYVHRFRRLTASSNDALREADERTTRHVQRQLNAADVIIVLLGTTIEMWRDAELGRPTNQIPPPEAFHAGEWTLDGGDLQGIREDLAAIKRLLAEHTKAVPVYSVCPIPLQATWLDRSVVDANGRGKALLRTALELEGTSPGVYLPLWDWMQAQTERRSPTKRDGRHFDRRGTNRVMLFAEQYLAAGEVAPIGIKERMLAQAQDLRERIASMRG
jgi:GSCFA family